MELSEIKRKKAKIKALTDQELDICKQIGDCDREIRRAKNAVRVAEAKKKKLEKRISHTMKLRHTIIKELP